MAEPLQAGNLPDDFPPERFALMAFCEGCGHSAALDRASLPPGLTVQAIPARLRCTACGRRPGTLRVVYTGAGGFKYAGAAMMPGLEGLGSA
ncbi:hypothetical protein CKO31_18275 [Thiohalocapsa halophila]|uniref:Uncharacterized protein n=1 Tax=Thiohalocapsa halophila TaxID=69359 RepID=A0ABS1CLT1_9GAMM|nr:hypothetical protein [Thiohalocapsa halophila]MBK1632653.1 hypothetical protein [Thiohalocapsa halophila]